MNTAIGRISAVQEGRFRLETDDGRSALFILHHGSRIEPQDLPGLAASGRRVLVDWTPSAGRVARIAHGIEAERRS